MELSPLLEWALIIASFSITVLVVCLVPLAFLAARRLERLSNSAEQLKVQIESLVKDSTEIVRQVDVIMKHGKQHLEDVGCLMTHLQKWAERTDRLVGNLADSIEEPVLCWRDTFRLVRDKVGPGLKRLFGIHNVSTNTKEENHE